MANTFLSLLYTIFQVSLYASAITIGPITDLSIINAQISPDGFIRVGVLAEGTFPGPVIVGQKGDVFRINVIDKLQDNSMARSTSIHWHGLNQHGTNWADGASSINQCPITPDNSFEYRFHAKDQAGTYWYHSHFSNQYCDGLRGPLIVYNPQDPHRLLYDVDDENTIITLADWYHKPSPQLGFRDTPASTLINGLGRYPGGPSSPLAVVHVKFGKRYRFRLISLSCNPNYIFSIDGHDLMVIEADGENTVPVTVNSIQIFAGQRYSFVLDALNPLDGNFWIRATPNTGLSNTTTSGDNDTNKINLGILRYKGAPEIEPTTEIQEDIVPLDERHLMPLENPNAPGYPTHDGADFDMNLVIGFSFTMHKYTINGVPYTPPSVPVLLQIMSGVARPDELLPAESIISIPANKTIQLSLPPAPDSVGGPHPMHLHGHPFSVIRSADTASYNFINPVRRDVVNTGMAGDNVTIRFFSGTGTSMQGTKGSSSGVWFLHCHINRHMEAGLAVVFVEQVDDVVSNNPIPEYWRNLCPAS